MAQEKEEVIFELKVEQGDALAEMEKFKKSILLTKQEQKELNKAFAAGSITLDEYVQDSVRLEGILKKQQSSYNQVQKSVTGVKTQLDKLIDSNKKISNDLAKTSKSFQDVAGNINIAGQNVGSLTTKLVSFANPATAAVGIATALGAAYAKSTIGAKDLEFAQNQLAEATLLVNNRFAELISSSEDGEGLVSKFTNRLIGFFGGATLQGQSKLLANLREEAEDLGRKEIEVRGQVSDRLTENQEKLTKIAEEQTSYNEKVQLGAEIVDNLKKNQSELKDVLDDQLGLIKIQLGFDKDNEQLLTLKLIKEREINKLVSDTAKKIQGQIRANQNVIDAQSGIISKANRDANRRGVTFSDNLDTTTDIGEVSGVFKEKKKQDTSIKDGSLAIIDSAKATNDALKKLSEDRVKFEEKNKAKEVQISVTADQAKLQSAAVVANAMQGIFEQGSELQRAIALVGIGIDTAEAISSAVAAAEQNPANGFTFGGAGALQFAMSLARILGNIAMARQYLGGAAAGGGDFVTKGPTMLMVGDNPGGVEHVSVKPISGKGKTVVNPYSNLVAMGGGGNLTAFSDGGLSVNSMTAETNQNVMMANMVKKTPVPKLDVKETMKVAKRIALVEGGSSKRVRAV